MSDEPRSSGDESTASDPRGGTYSWLIPVIAIVVVVAAVVLGLMLHQNAPPPDEIPEAPDEIPSGEELYVEHCAHCHGRDGQGVGARFPPLVDTRWVLDDDERLILITLYGLRGPIEVRGQTYDAVMPGLSRHLSNEEAAELLTYVRTSWGNDGEQITVDDVASVRDDYPPPDDPWTVERLEERNAQ